MIEEPPVMQGATVFSELLILIPTRNRSDLAVLAMQSVVSQLEDMPVRIVVSDNSSDQFHTDALNQEAKEIGGSALFVIRPSVSMSMTRHWEWALQSAIAIGSPSHVLILTDRMAFKHGALRQIVEAVRRRPDDVISYSYDRIDDLSAPVRFMPLPRSGHSFRIPSSDILMLSADMKFYSFMPRMLNCVAPLSVIESLNRKHGSVFSSVSPDYRFCYRVLDHVHSIVYFDSSVLVSFGQRRSNGGSSVRGVITPESLDFVESTGAASINAMTPLPEIRTVGNAVIHEYLAAKAESGSERFPELSRPAYLLFLGLEHLKFEDVAHRSRGLMALRREGMPYGIRFWWTAFKHKIEAAVLRLMSERFATFMAAFEFSTNEPSRRTPWRQLFLRRYRFEKLED